MRLSSVIIFTAFALLASASLIDDYSQRNNSLWRRKLEKEDKSQLPPFDPGPPPRTIDYRDGDLMLIEDVYEEGEVVRSFVTPRDGRRIPYRPLLGGHQTGNVFFEFNVSIPGWPIHTRDYNSPQRHESHEWFTLMRVLRPGGGWRIFYPGQQHENSDYTFTRVSLFGGGNVRQFFKGNQVVLLRLDIVDAHESWKREAMLHNYDIVEWLGTPTNRRR